MVEIGVYSTVGASEDELPKFRDYVLRSRGGTLLKVNSIWMRVSADGGSGLMELFRRANARAESYARTAIRAHSHPADTGGQEWRIEKPTHLRFSAKFEIIFAHLQPEGL